MLKSTASVVRFYRFAAAMAHDVVILLGSLALLRRTGLRLVRSETARPETKA